MLVTLEGAQDSGRSTVLVRALGDQPSAPRRLADIAHAPGSARRGIVARIRGRWTALVVVAERNIHNGAYDSALYRVDARGAARLVGGLANASTPLVTEEGDVLVERGAAGVEPSPRGPLREDTLELVAVDSESGATRVVHRTRGQLAHLAAALRGREVLVYKIDGPSSALFSLDVGTGATRSILAAMPGPARDFSYDRARDAVTFARAHNGAYELVSIDHVSAGPSLVTRLRAQSEHLMPLALGAGRVAFDSPEGLGLAMIDERGAPRLLAPLGAGIDRARFALGEWVAFEHRATRGLTTAHALVHLTRGSALSIAVDSATDSTLIGLVPAGGAL